MKLVFLRKPDAAPTQGIRSCRAIALTSVMSKWYASCILLRLEKEKEPEKWKKLHIGGFGWDKLPALASDGEEHDTETLGVAGGKKSRDETRDGGKTNNVPGKLGYQDGLR